MHAASPLPRTGPAETVPTIDRGQQWKVSGAILLATLATLTGLHVILEGIGWWLQLGVLSALVLASAAVVRHLTARRFLPPIVAALVLVAALTLFFAPGTAFLGIVPTAESFGRFRALIDAAVVSINQQALPAVANIPITFLLCIGVGALTWLADLVALSLRSPALAGIPLVVLLAVPSAVAIDSTDPFTFVAAAIAYLLLLRSAVPRRLTGTTASLAAVIVVGTMIVPLVLPSVTPAEVTGSGLSTGVNPVLTLGNDLRQDVDHTVLDYSTTSGDGHYLRLVSVDKFVGSSWGPDNFSVDRGNTTGKLGNAPGLSVGVARTTEVSYIDVKTLTTPWLPLPYPTTTVSGLVGDWYWDPTGLVVRSPSQTADGETYRALSLTIAPTPAQLEAAGTSVPPGFSRFLDLPGDLPSIISSTAKSVAGGAANNYEKALLLQDYFRGGDFAYSETAPAKGGYDGTGMKVVAAFLTAKAGYCIHFASAMAVMARSLGIPSRIAVGFLPGTRVGLDSLGRPEFAVTSHDLHAWPELYFDGIGWTRFEPTPGRGDVPSYADQSLADVPVPVNSQPASTVPSASARPSASAVPNAHDSSSSTEANGSSGGGTASWIWAASILLLGAIGLALPGPARGVQRNRRVRSLRGGTAPAVTAWREVLQSAHDFGVVIPETATPREAEALLGSGAAGAIPALARLRAAVERESYAEPTSPGAYAGAARDVLTVVGWLRSSAGRWQRVLARVAPRSLWSRAFSRVNRDG
jgi:transglutaminase-like putative cysteine protease